MISLGRLKIATKPSIKGLGKSLLGRFGYEVRPVRPVRPSVDSVAVGWRT